MFDSAPLVDKAPLEQFAGQRQTREQRDQQMVGEAAMLADSDAEVAPLRPAEPKTPDRPALGG